MNRRRFLKTLSAAGALALTPLTLLAKPERRNFSGPQPIYQEITFYGTGITYLNKETGKIDGVHDLPLGRHTVRIPA